jgi:uncharacterized protein (DUF1778 family)
MPTSKPRITLTLSEQQHELLQSLAELQRVSMSSIVVDLLDTTMPVLGRLASILKSAAEAPQSVLDELRKSLEVAESDALGKKDSVMDQLDLLVAAAGGRDARERTPTPAAKPAPKKAGPPTTNRGVRIPSSNARKPRPHAASKPFGKVGKK